MFDFIGFSNFGYLIGKKDELKIVYYFIDTKYFGIKQICQRNEI